MKIRSGFVSNSSSSSFMIYGQQEIKKAVTLFTEDFGEWLCGDVYRDWLGNSLTIYTNTNDFVLNGNSYNLIDFVCKVKNGDIDLTTINDIEFNCDDWDSGSMEWLTFLYTYFTKLGITLNCDESERAIGDSGLLVNILKRFEAKHENT